MMFIQIPTRFFFLAICTVLAFFACSNTTYANNKYASIVVDAETGKVLRARNANKILHPASLTKIMTLYMAFDALSRGQLKLKDRVPISRRANGMEPSKLGLPVGSSIRVEDAIYSLVTKSANDVAVALGEKIAGSEWAFAKRMTSKARDLGMKNTVFRNASGLPDKKQVSTARDMAILARALIYNHPQYYHYFSTKNFSYRGKNYRNHNRLMSTYKGMDGIKTGYIHASGFNLVASAVRENRRLVAVVFGGRTSRTRNAHMAEIMDQGFVLARKLPKTRIAQLHQRTPVRSPLPASKPNTMQVVLASLEASSLANAKPTSQASNDNEMSARLGAMLGQGDIDPKEANRIEAGLIAMATHTRQRIKIDGIGAFDGRDKKKLAVGEDNLVVNTDRAWAIQIGAYSSQNISGQAVRVASKSLPPELRKNVKSQTVPLTTGSRTIYRARMAGFNEFEAQKACAYLRNCMVISP